jgi:hypothetical protein
MLLGVRLDLSSSTISPYRVWWDLGQITWPWQGGAPEAAAGCLEWSTPDARAVPAGADTPGRRHPQLNNRALTKAI